MVIWLFPRTSPLQTGSPRGVLRGVEPHELEPLESELGALLRPLSRRGPAVRPELAQGDVGLEAELVGRVADGALEAVAAVEVVAALLVARPVAHLVVAVEAQRVVEAVEQGLHLVCGEASHLHVGERSVAGAEEVGSPTGTEGADCEAGMGHGHSTLIHLPVQICAINLSLRFPRFTA